jgi:hypothetical protein
MSELTRLVDDPDSSAVEVSLLTAARMDAPSAASRRACAAALGLAAAGTTATAGAASAKAALGAGAAWKWLGVLVLVGAVAGGLFYQSRRGGDGIDAPPATPITTAAQTAPAPPAPAQDPVVSPSPSPATLPPPPAPVPVDTPVVRARRTERAATITLPSPPENVPPIIAAPPEPPAVTPPPTPTSRLAEEVALLDTARDALSAGDLRAASAALATHLVEFQQGVLVPESEILRIEVHLGLGQGPAAVALATRFLERFPDNALAKRARTLLERATRM